MLKARKFYSQWIDVPFRMDASQHNKRLKKPGCFRGWVADKIIPGKIIILIRKEKISAQVLIYYYWFYKLDLIPYDLLYSVSHRMQLFHHTFIQCQMIAWIHTGIMNGIHHWHNIYLCLLWHENTVFSTRSFLWKNHPTKKWTGIWVLKISARKYWMTIVWL